MRVVVLAENQAIGDLVPVDLADVFGEACTPGRERPAQIVEGFQLRVTLGIGLGEIDRDVIQFTECDAGLGEAEINRPPGKMVAVFDSAQSFFLDRSDDLVVIEEHSRGVMRDGQFSVIFRLELVPEIHAKKKRP